MKNSSIITALLVLLLPTALSNAEVIKANNYIMEWMLLGPITDTGSAAISTNVDWLVDCGGESEIRPSEGDEMEVSGEKYRWRRYRIPEIGGNELEPLGNFEYSTAYLAIYVKFDQNGRVEFLFGSDAGFAAWINGIEIARAAKHRNWVQDSDSGEIHVKAGQISLVAHDAKGFIIVTHTDAQVAPRPDTSGGRNVGRGGQSCGR